MKMFLNYLTEAKADDDYARNYSAIPREIFDQIAKMDPKALMDGDTVSMIGFGTKQLLLPKYLGGEHDFVSHPEDVKKALTDYYANIKNYPKFAEFRSVQDFLTFMENPETAEIQKAIIESPIDKLYNKYYNDINREDFDKIIALDPDTKPDKIGEIAKNLLLKSYRKGDTAFIQKPDDVKKACEEFYKSKHVLPQEKQDLNSYDTIDEFIRYISEGPESSLVASLRSNNTVDPTTHNAVKDDIRVVGSTTTYDILEPKSHRANNAISGGWNSNDGMHWCTGWEPDASGENDRWWKNYTNNGSRLFCFMNKAANRGTENRTRNWQIQVRSNNTLGEFLDGRDFNGSGFPGASKEEQFKNFLTAYPDICLAIKDKEPFSQMLVVQQVADTIKYANAPFDINSEEDIQKVFADTGFKNMLKIVNVNIEKVPVALFAGAVLLEQVNFGNNVKEIGAQAFKNCPLLNTPVFPESLEIIGVEAFAQCMNIKGSIKIPNSVTEIRARAFAGDHCKLKIDQARTTRLRFDVSDATWVKSHIQGIKVQ